MDRVPTHPPPRSNLRRYSGRCTVDAVHLVDDRLAVMNRLGRAMSDPSRSRILLALLDSPGYPAQLADELTLTRQNVSNHLACLRDCGIVVAEPEGRHTRYELADPHLAQALGALLETTLMVDESAACLDAACPVPGCCEPPA